jgi:hypothetical protein
MRFAACVHAPCMHGAFTENQAEGRQANNLPTLVRHRLRRLQIFADSQRVRSRHVPTHVRPTTVVANCCVDWQRVFGTAALKKHRRGVHLFIWKS